MEAVTREEFSEQQWDNMLEAKSLLSQAIRWLEGIDKKPVTNNGDVSGLIADALGRCGFMRK